MKILALTISIGMGHDKAIDAVREHITKNHSNIEFKVVDTLKYINPVIDRFVAKSYLSSLKFNPNIFKKLFKYSEYDGSLLNLSEIMNELLSIKLCKLLKSYKPDIVLVSHFFPLEMMSILKRRKKTNVTVVGLITDYYPHPFWLHDMIDAYVIPCDELVHTLTSHGIPKDTIYPYGIPVRDSFTEAPTKAEARNILGIAKNTITVLLMGGGLGMGNIKRLFEKLALSTLDIQIIACAGKNAALSKELKAIKRLSDKTILLYDYTDKISILMAASDILISKPGGLTVAESLFMHMPFVIASPIPGQEEKNADYLMNIGSAARLRKIDDIVSLLERIIASPTRLRFMEESAKENAKTDSTKNISQLLISLALKRAAD